MNIKEFYQYTLESDDNIKKDFNNHFEIKCKKCQSLNVYITDLQYDYDGESTLTGRWGEEVKCTIKCRSCGNAVEIVQ